MSIINKKLMGFMFNASALNLAGAAWKGNVNTIIGFNSAGTGYVSYKPSSNFNSLTQLVPDGVYTVDAATTGFDIPGAVLTLVGLGSGGGTTGPASKTLVLFIGDSTTGDNATQGHTTTGYTGGTGTGYTSKAVARIGAASNVTYLNCGWAGKSAQWYIDNQLTSTLALMDFTTYDQVVCCLAFGLNDLTTQFAPQNYASDAAGVFAAIKQLGVSLKTKDSTKTKVLVLPVTNREDSYATATFNADRRTLNNLLRTRYTEFADAFAEPREQRGIYSQESPKRTALFYDKVHRTGSGGTYGLGGAGVEAELTAKYLAPLVGVSPLVPAYRQDMEYPVLTWGFAVNGAATTNSGTLAYSSTLRDANVAWGSGVRATDSSGAAFSFTPTSVLGLQFSYQLEDHVPATIPKPTENGTITGFTASATPAGGDYTQVVNGFYFSDSKFRVFESGTNKFEVMLPAGIYSMRVDVVGETRNGVTGPFCHYILNDVEVYVSAAPLALVPQYIDACFETPGVPGNASYIDRAALVTY